MGQQQTQITITETDNGFRIDVTGKKLHEAFSSCCMPMFGGAMAFKSACCASDAENAAECCAPGSASSAGKSATEEEKSR